jgi:toxin-antitoxin system PIN domain toxin
VKLLDANVLLYAYDSSSAHHSACRVWLEGVLNADEPVGLPWQTSLAFIRISTNPRAVRTPLAVEDACAIIEAILERSTVLVVEPGDQFWRLFRELLRSARVSGPLVSDAVLAALALEQGATLCSSDRDFRRFAELRLLDPTEEN